MKAPLLRILTVAFIAFAACLQAAARDKVIIPPDQATLAAHEKSLADAMTWRDWTVFERWCSQNFVEVDADGSIYTFTQRQALMKTQLLQPNYKLSGFQMLAVSNGTVALMYQLQGQLTQDKTTAAINEQVTDFWGYQGRNRWKIVFRQVTPIVKEK